jgi:hypothetical protein
MQNPMSRYASRRHGPVNYGRVSLQQQTRLDVVASNFEQRGPASTEAVMTVRPRSGACPAWKH